MIALASSPLSGALHAARRLVRPKAGIQRVFVVLTDGHPDNPHDTITEAHRIRNSGGRVVSIGVGREVRQGFLRGLASSPADFHFCDESIALEDTFINLATVLAQP